MSASFWVRAAPKSWSKYTTVTKLGCLVDAVFLSDFQPQKYKIRTNLKIFRQIIEHHEYCRARSCMTQTRVISNMFNKLAPDLTKLLRCRISDGRTATWTWNKWKKNQKTKSYWQSFTLKVATSKLFANPQQLQMAPPLILFLFINVTPLLSLYCTWLYFDCTRYYLLYLNRQFWTGNWT